MAALSILQAILALSVLIIVHEFGHYLCARMTGMHVDRFSILGIGAPIVRLFTYKGTEFVISAIPFGAYVHIVGMEAEPDEAESQILPPGTRSYRDSAWAARLFAIAGGPLANYLAAMAIMTALFLSMGQLQVTHVAAAGFSEGAPTAAAGMKEGDRLVEIAGEPVTGAKAYDAVIAATSKNLGKTVPVVIEREGVQQTLEVKLNDQAPALQTQLQNVGDYVDVSIGDAITQGIAWPIDQTQRQLSFFGKMITGERQGSLSGPVGIVSQLANSLQSGLPAFIMLLALVSTALGMMNLFPLPALDGGRAVFLFIELFTKRRPKELEERVHGYGMLVLLALLAVITVKEVYQKITAPSADEVTETSKDK